MPREELTRIERLLLVHLLDHRGNQVRFEADQWTTEFGIARKFAGEDPSDLKNAMRTLEMSRMIYRRTQYARRLLRTEACPLPHRDGAPNGDRGPARRSLRAPGPV